MLWYVMLYGSMLCYAVMSVLHCALLRCIVMFLRLALLYCIVLCYAVIRYDVECDTMLCN
jgi:hypothetical protein